MCPHEPPYPSLRLPQIGCLCLVFIECTRRRANRKLSKGVTVWFTEDAWSPGFLLVACGIIGYVAYVLTRRERLLLTIPVIILLLIATFVVERMFVTDREMIETRLRQLVDTFCQESRDGSRTNEPVCTEYFAVSNKRDRSRVAAAVSLVRISDCRVTDVNTQITNQETRAVTRFRANGNVVVGSAGGHYASRWEVTWQKESGDWKITTTRMLNVMTGEEQHIPQIDR